MYGHTDFHDEQCSSRPLVLAETIAKVEQEQEMLEERHVTVRELCEQIPEVSKSTIDNVAGEFYDKGIREMPTAHAKVHRSQKWLRRKIAESTAFQSVFIAKKHIFYVQFSYWVLQLF